jgi:predicted SprT family Zn-dependent metalloprotease
MKNLSITFEKEDLELLADYFFELFLPHFKDARLNRLGGATTIEFSNKMKNKVGLAVLFENKIRLSMSYFANSPQLLPYTLFHEMTHLWLYHSGFDPGHTKRFYQKMLEFRETGYMIDPEVHVHTRLAGEGSYVYICGNCENRWHLKEELRHNIYCALCYKKNGIEHYATLHPDFNSHDHGKLDKCG